MPKKTAKEGKRKKRDYARKLFWVLNNLSEEKLNHADELNPTDEQLIEFQLEAVDTGLDIKVGWDDYSDCYQATAVGAWEDFPSEGYAVSARSSRDTRDALVLVWYKVVVLAEGDLSSIATDKDVDDMRG